MATNVCTHSRVSDYLDALGRIGLASSFSGFAARLPRRRVPMAWESWNGSEVPLTQRAAGTETPFVVAPPSRKFSTIRTHWFLRPLAAVALPDRFDIVEDPRGDGEHQPWFVELLRSATARYMRCTKVHWYRAFDVEECWLVDTRQRRVKSTIFAARVVTCPLIYKGRDHIGSRLLPSAC